MKVVSKSSARFPALNHRGQSERGFSSFQMMSILSVIHVRTQDNTDGTQNLAIGLFPNVAHFVLQALKYIPRNIPN
jgi:hypothetical protein